MLLLPGRVKQKQIHRPALNIRSYSQNQGLILLRLKRTGFCYVLLTGMIGQIQNRLKEIGVDATIDAGAAACLLAQQGMDPAEGARLLKREIRKQIEDPLAQQYLAGAFSKGDTIFCEMGPELTVHKILS